MELHFEITQALTGIRWLLLGPFAPYLWGAVAIGGLLGLLGLRREA